MSDQYLIFDLLRIAIAAGALWLGVLILRLCWTRWSNPDPTRQDVHPFTYLSFALALFSIGGFRIAALGEAPEIRLVITSVIVGLGLVGVLKRVELGKPFSRGR